MGDKWTTHAAMPMTIDGTLHHCGQYDIDLTSVNYDSIPTLS